MSSMRQRNELELLEELRRGNASAVASWYRAYYAVVLGFVATKTTHPADAEEITQEVFINALRQLPLFRGDSSLLTWMMSIARHEVADYYRKKYAKKVLQLISLEVVPECGMPSTSSDAPLEHIVSSQVDDVLSQLQPDHRELLFLKYVDQKSVSDIARELCRSIKAIESDLFRARSRFRDLYIASYAEEH